MIKHTKEQKSLLSARQGFHVCAANAGTGKTQTSAELAVNLYELEEKKLFPGCNSRVTGADQNRLLDTVLCLTFSRKAAAELDERIKQIMGQREIPIPQRRLCWTFDAYLLSVFRKNRIFAQFLRMIPATKVSLHHLWDCLPARTRTALEHEVVDSKQYGTTLEKLLWMKYSWVQNEKVYVMIADSIVRESMNSRIANNWRLKDLKSRFDDYLQHLELVKNKGFSKLDSSQFWDSEYNKWLKAYEEERQLSELKDEGSALSEGQDKIVEEYRSVAGIRDDLLGFNGIARAFNFDPNKNQKALCNRRLIQAFCGLEHLKSIELFLKLARMFSQAKFDFLIMDFSDLLFYFNQIIRGDTSLMERNVEYPKLKIRRKCVIWDEVQDNSMAQHKVMESFMADDQVPYLVAIVGDYKQSIYEWRGSDPFQFRKRIEELRQNSPENFHPMTRCFRSAQSIVDLGNSVVRTLPTYKSLVIDSVCNYSESGNIEVAPPHQDALQEAQWIVEQCAEIRKKDSKATIMLLFRNSPQSHAGWFHLQALLAGDRGIEAMTIHRSKGAQADYVFVLSCNSGLIPSPRGGWDQEINLFYVACTRARWKVSFSVCALEEPPKGYPAVLPSMFFYEVPELSEAMLLSGDWTREALETGRRHGFMLLCNYLQRMEERKLEVSRELERLFDTQANLHPEPATDIGSAQVESSSNTPKRESLAQNCEFERQVRDFRSAPVQSKVNSPAVEKEAPPEVQCKDLFLKYGHSGISKLTPHQRALFIKKGLICSDLGVLKFVQKLI